MEGEPVNCPACGGECFTETEDCEFTIPDPEKTVTGCDDCEIFLGSREWDWLTERNALREEVERLRGLLGSAIDSLEQDAAISESNGFHFDAAYYRLEVARLKEALDPPQEEPDAP